MHESDITKHDIDSAIVAMNCSIAVLVAMTRSLAKLYFGEYAGLRERALREIDALENNAIEAKDQLAGMIK